VRRRRPVGAEGDVPPLARGAGPDDRGVARQRPVLDEVREEDRARAQTAWGELAWLARAVDCGGLFSLLHRRDSRHRHHLLGDGGALPPPAMMASGEPAVDRACGGAGATGGTTTFLSRPSSSFVTSLHHDSPGAQRRRCGSIPALRLNCCCWLLGQGDGPVLCGLHRDLLDVRRAGRRRAR
jgi:hypothetical protein